MPTTEDVLASIQRLRQLTPPLNDEDTTYATERLQRQLAERALPVNGNLVDLTSRLKFAKLHNIYGPRMVPTVSSPSSVPPADASRLVDHLGVISPAALQAQLAETEAVAAAAVAEAAAAKVEALRAIAVAETALAKAEAATTVSGAKVLEQQSAWPQTAGPVNSEAGPLLLLQEKAADAAALAVAGVPPNRTTEASSSSLSIGSPPCSQSASAKVVGAVVGAADAAAAERNNDGAAAGRQTTAPNMAKFESVCLAIAHGLNATVESPREEPALSRILGALVDKNGPGNIYVRDVDTAYKDAFAGITLTEMVKTRTTGDFQRFLLYLISPRAEIDAANLERVMSVPGSDSDLFIELLCTRSNAELVQATVAYSQQYGRELLATIETRTSGNLQKLLRCVLEAAAEGDAAPMAEAALPELAAQLRSALESFKTNEDALVSLLCRAQPEIWAPEMLPRVYAETFEGRSLLEDVEQNTRGELQRVLMQKVSPSRWHVWAMLLHNAGQAKLGTDEETVVRVLGSCHSEGRSYRDSLLMLATTYEEMFGGPLVEMLQKELTDGVFHVVSRCFPNSLEV
eukprot:SAG31_NODE_1666_length_7581_cov_2.398022_4_plen_573_part_00